VRRLLSDERGQASAELMGMMVWLLLVTLIVWQICLAAWTYTQVSNAARTASRVEGRGGDAKKAARNALAGPLRKNIKLIKIEGDRAEVTVLIPLVVPGVFTTPNLTAHREAELPG
jgi:TadE-like protein